MICEASLLARHENSMSHGQNPRAVVFAHGEIHKYVWSLSGELKCLFGGSHERYIGSAHVQSFSQISRFRAMVHISWSSAARRGVRDVCQNWVIIASLLVISPRAFTPHSPVKLGQRRSRPAPYLGVRLFIKLFITMTRIITIVLTIIDS